MFPSYTSSSASKVKQEILHGLGDLYTQAHMMFNVDMYLQLLGILHLAIRSSKNSSNVEREAYPDAYGDIATSHLNQIVWRKLLPVIVKLNLEASPTETFSESAEVFHGLGRCMTARRDNPNGTLWKVAVDGFNNVLIDAISRIGMENKVDQNAYKILRENRWKEVADVYEMFLVGPCGSVPSSSSPSVEALDADEFIEMNPLSILVDKVLKRQTDVPLEILERIGTTLDRCASGIDSLLLESVRLMPSHCSRFSLNCLKTVFFLMQVFSNRSMFQQLTIFHSNSSGFRITAEKSGPRKLQALGCAKVELQPKHLRSY